MGKFLIAVGGTGQEVALACMRLSHLAGDAVDLPWVYVFDSDIGDSLEGSQHPTRLQLLRNIERDAFIYRGQESHLKLLDVFRKQDRKIETLDDLFGGYGTSSPELNEALDLVVTKEQRDTRITDGFHGKPIVGAIAFGDYVIDGIENLFGGVRENGTEIRGLFSEIRDQPDVSHYVLLVGGTCGGTGTSVLPVVAPKVRDWLKQQKERNAIGVGTPALGRSDIQTSLIVQVPWFRLTERRVEGKEGDRDLDFEQMRSNAACLLQFYRDELDQFADRILLAGLPEQVERPSQGPNRQFETEHYLNVVCGWLGAELMVSSTWIKQMPDPGFYGFAFESRRQGAEDGELNLEDILSDQLRMTSTGQRGEISLATLLNASRILIAFSWALRQQLLQPKEPALPPEVRALADHLGQEDSRKFRDELKVWEDFELQILKWCSRCFTADSSGPKVPDYLKEVSKLSDLEVSREKVAAQLLTGITSTPKGFEMSPAHRLVASLMKEGGLVQAARVLRDPQDMARAIHRKLRNQLLARLIE